MKDINLMHYLLVLNVWSIPCKILVRQGKYKFEILSIFGMMECKSMATPIMKNMKKLCDSTLDSNMVDPTMHR
jgi:hypothetical protein